MQDIFKHPMLDASFVYVPMKLLKLYSKVSFVVVVVIVAAAPIFGENYITDFTEDIKIKLRFHTGVGLVKKRW
jgi:hypothetical protein